MFGCTSPLKKGLDLGDPAPISKAPSPASVSQGDGIKVIAMPLKQTVELGEPVYLALRVINEGQEPVNIIGRLRPGEGLIEIYSNGAKGEKVILPPIGESDFDGITSLAPNQTIGDVFPIFFGANGWNFTEAGEYRISALLKIPTKGGFLSFSSEPAVIKVESSEAGQALFSAEQRSSIEAGKYLLWRSGDHLEAGIELLTSLSEQHPNSVLSSYISAAHAQNYSEPFANYKTGKVRAPDCQKANSFRQMVNTDVLTENLLIEDYISQAKCHAENQNWEEARIALDSGSRLSADRPEFMAYYQSIAKMQERLRQYIE
jgi:hypothetical protein